MKLLASLFLGTLFFSVASAQVPRTLSYQGLLTDSLGTPLPDGSYSVTFKLYQTSSGGSASWQEGKLVQVTRGVFSTSLGDITPVSLPFDVEYWLGVQVGSDPELSPRMKLNASGYSFRSITAETSNIADSARTAGSIPNNIVATQKIQDGAVTQAKLAGGVSLPPGGAAGGDLTGTYPNPTIANSTITSAKILDGTITDTDLTNNAVTTAKLANSSVTTQKINSAGAQNGQALMYDGTGVAWGTPSSMLPLPYSGSTSATSGVAVLSVANSATSGTVPAIRGSTSSLEGSAVGVLGEVSSTSPGGFSAAVRGISNGTGTQGIGVRGSHAGSGWGVFGSSPSGRGVYGETTNGVGVRGQATSTSGVNYGVWGETASVLGTGVHGFAPSGIGVKGVTNSSIGIGVRGEATATSGPDAGVYGTSASANGSGVFGVASSTSTSGTHYGVRGMAQDVTGGFGVRGDGLIGVYGDGTSYGVYSFGNFGASGLKSFQIDHPVDPKNKYLNHYCAEGAEPLNAYSGNTTLDARGSAIVKLPEYFDQINKDFRYQLTPVGSAAPNLHIAEEIQNNRFRIAGGNSGQKISWRVEALRNDLWVRQHGAPVDVEKSNEHRGKYLQPELFGQPMELGIHYSATPNEEVDASRLTQAREAMRTIPEPSPRKEQ